MDGRKTFLRISQIRKQAARIAQTDLLPHPASSLNVGNGLVRIHPKDSRGGFITLYILHLLTEPDQVYS